MSSRSIHCGLALILATGLCFADTPSPGTISTSGEATVYVVPSEVLVNLGVESFHASLATARAQNEEACARLVKALRGAGIEQKHIQADHADVEIVYNTGGIATGIAGYRVRRAYAVTLKNVDGFERLIDAALQNGANHLAGFEYRTLELKKHRDEARRLAIRAAREKAAALAAELGCSIGGPRTIGEGYSSWFGQYGSWWGYRQGAGSQVSVQAPGAGGAEGGETLLLGQIGVRASISVVFELLPGAPPR